MRNAGEDDAIHVREDLVEGLPVLGRGGGEERANIARLDLGKDGQRLDAALVIGDPVEGRVPREMMA